MGTIPEENYDDEVVEHDEDETPANPRFQALLDYGAYHNPESTQLEKAVIKIIVESIDPTDEALDRFYRDLQRGGCASGLVGSLVYTGDANKFYDDNYDDIEDLRQQYESDFGEPVYPMTSSKDYQHLGLKNFYAWWAFEDVTFKLFEEYLDQLETGERDATDNV